MYAERRRCTYRCTCRVFSYDSRLISGARTHAHGGAPQHHQAKTPFLLRVRANLTASYSSIPTVSGCCFDRRRLSPPRAASPPWPERCQPPTAVYSWSLLFHWIPAAGRDTALRRSLRPNLPLPPPKKQGAYKASQMAKKLSIAAIIIGVVTTILTSLFETETIDDGASDGSGGSFNNDSN